MPVHVRIALDVLRLPDGDPVYFRRWTRPAGEHFRSTSVMVEISQYHRKRKQKT